MDAFGDALALVSYSHDGVHGKLMSFAPRGLTPRFWHAACVHDNRMYVSGGEDKAGNRLRSVQSSMNGMDWVENTAATPFVGRSDHCMASFMGKLVILGGAIGGGYTNQVWSSVDYGKTWVREMPRTKIWEERSGALCLVYNNRLWIMGGEGGMVGYNDVWYTQNLQDWVKVAADPEWLPRAFFEGCVYDNRMFFVGGKGGPGVTFKDVWFSRDGEMWEKSFDLPNGVSDTAVVPLDNRLFVYAGDGDPTHYYRLNMG
jgi:hypothetical protein